MNTLLAFGDGPVPGKYGSPPPDYWNAIGLSGILQILMVLTCIIVVLIWILSITSKRRRD
jgi:hypothetical protein